ncbi:alpha/beta fold hydrolase BchO [Tateyamaria omphalii]|uniref:Magnesium chelatase n=1 Tax=Tateyamaria omphalii TaxID=299262 RepID=A0A1P8N1N4_9RHOB|nr:alpha/beta fold hydrolase BchO [Tateyamaria omphalii]APX14182.1 magnesium chelatase [Tateyamaria omphalii]
MDWSQIKNWPNAELSRRGQGPVHRWHIQEAGAGKTVLMLHGAGGSTHSYRDLIPTLAGSFRVIALDLPGHGFTQLGARHRCGLDAMAQDVQRLCDQEGWAPDAIIGHSAGGAVALRLAESDLSPRGQTPLVIGINAATEQFKGVAGLLFPVMAKALAAVPFTASLFSGASANPERIKALIGSTGSDLDAEGLDLYRRLVGDRNHVDGTLLMMAQWRLDPLLARLPDHPAQVHLLVGDKDTTVPPTVSRNAATRMRDATVHLLEGLGHLAHEERPVETAALIRDIIRDGLR